MNNSKNELIKYRLQRAWATFEDALILAEKQRWNSTINRLYYAAYYAVMALLINEGLKPTTHNGAKSNFTQYFIKTEQLSIEFGKIYSQLFTWRQKGDYDDLFDFDREKVEPYIKPVEALIKEIENRFNTHTTTLQE
jgi:uncharacterized protein (UPF0332 family)